MPLYLFFLFKYNYCLRGSRLVPGLVWLEVGADVLTLDGTLFVLSWAGCFFFKRNKANAITISSFILVKIVRQ